MKRFILLLIPIILLLAGCTESPTASVTLAPSFSSNVNITVGETVYGANMSRFADGYWRVELDTPTAVRGLIFTISGGNTEVDFDGLRFTFDTARFPVGSVVGTAIDNLDRILSGPIDVINGEENCLATGSIGEESYAMTLSKTHVPQKLELTECGMTIEFTSYDVIEFVEE